MTDAELLQFAYLAIGKTGTAQVLPIRGFMMEETGREMLAIPVGEDGGWWNSLTQDKHAFELLVSIGFRFEKNIINNYFCVSFYDGEMLFNMSEKIENGGEGEAARRAITMAAAKVGEHIHEKTPKK